MHACVSPPETPSCCPFPTRSPWGQTLHAAYINNEDAVKGTLQKGKLADMIILDRNPTKADPKTIQDTKVGHILSACMHACMH